MVRRPEAPFRSGNAGELSDGLKGRVDIKQYYSGGLRYKNIEPVPLSGFRRMAGSLDLGLARCRPAALEVTGTSVTAGPHTGTQTLWSGTVAGKVMAVDFSAMAATSGTHTLQVEVLIGGVWTAFGAVQTVATAVARTVAVAPGKAPVATGVRVRGTFSASASINLGTVTVLTETATLDYPRFTSLKHDSGARYFAALTVGFMDIWQDDAWVAGVRLADIDAAELPNVNFYAESATIGIFHNSQKTLRVLRAGSSGQWNRDEWPYVNIPTADLGGSYNKTSDRWDITVKWTGTPQVYVTFTVDNETTEGVPFVDASDAVVAIGTSDAAKTAAAMKAALEALPSLGGTITVAITSPTATSRRIRITFGGSLSGREYQLTSIITNTADASALASHITIGKTDYEPLLSVSRGWPGVTGFSQERLVYGDVKAEPAALSMSRSGEYFDLNIKAAGPSAGRLDKLRAGQVSERILAIAEATYLLVATDKAVHFAANRAITATEPPNFVRTSTVGTVPNCPFTDLDSKMYFVGVAPKSDPPVGASLMSIAYSEIDAKFQADPEHLLATHLVEGITRVTGQVSGSEDDASRLWLMRRDGRLVAASIISAQEVLGFHEWVLASGGLVREIHVDAGNDLRICVERGGQLRLERLSRASLFQGTVVARTDLAGIIQGLEQFEGQEVWARTAGGYVLGPFTVAAGRADLGNPYDGDVQVGLWQRPVFESMPRYFMGRDEQVLVRPGRIHSATLNVEGTTSIAVGANDTATENIPLVDLGDPADGPPVAKTRACRRTGMPGSKTGSTFVVTQHFPGELYVRDYSLGEAL